MATADDDEFDDLDDDLGFDEPPQSEKKEKSPSTGYGPKSWCLKNNKIKVNLRNLTLIFENDPLLKDKVARNDFAGDFVKTDKMLGIRQKDETNGDLWIDHYDIKLSIT